MRRSGRRVLIVAPAGDGHARAVLGELRRAQVAAVQVDTARFPEAASLSARLEAGAPWRAHLAGGSGPVDAEGLRAVWWWRPAPHRLHRSLRGPGIEGAYCAASAALRAFWWAAGARWVNPRDAEAAADDKPRQLALAARLGLAVPRSLVTNDPAAARAFIAERAAGDTIHKHVTSAFTVARPTGLALAADRRLLASLRHLPLLLQERVPCGADLRVTVVDGEPFAAEIVSPEGVATVDWRPGFGRARVHATKLPGTLEAPLLRLVRELGLAYAALDLRRRPDGEHVFLEVNPAGQWLFAERAAGLRVTRAVAALLARRAGRR